MQLYLHALSLPVFLRISQVLEPIPAVIRQGKGFTLDRLPVYDKDSILIWVIYIHTFTNYLNSIVALA